MLGGSGGKLNHVLRHRLTSVAGYRHEVCTTKVIKNVVENQRGDYALVMWSKVKGDVS